MAKVVNLRQVRKRAARAAKDDAATANRAKHGISKAERGLSQSQSALDTRRFDAHRIDIPTRKVPESL